MLADESVMHLACGGAHSAALTQDGSLYLWGKNHHGQLGMGDIALEQLPEMISRTRLMIHSPISAHSRLAGVCVHR